MVQSSGHLNQAIFRLYYTVLSSIPLLRTLHCHLTNFPVTTAMVGFAKGEGHEDDFDVDALWEAPALETM